MVEIRKAKMIVNKSGAGNSTFRATLPASWIRRMGLGEDLRNLKLGFNGKEITIKNNEEEIEMLNKLLEVAKVEVEKEMKEVGFVYDGDNAERFLDKLAEKLVSDEVLKGNDDIDFYYEKEGEIEELSEELLANIKEYVKDNYNHVGEVDDRGDYAGYYHDTEKLYESVKELESDFEIGSNKHEH